MGNNRVVFRVIAGGYLSYIGFKLITDALKEKPDHYIGFLLAGIAFALLGVSWVAYSVVTHIKKSSRNSEENSAETDTIEESTEESVTVEDSETDQDKE